MGDVEPIQPEQIYWWAVITNRRVLPEEVDVLFAVDSAYLGQLAKEAAAKRARDEEAREAKNPSSGTRRPKKPPSKR